LTVTPNDPAAAREKTKAGTRAHFLRAPRFRPRSVHVLIALVAVSMVAHVIASFLRATAVFFPDEYLYSELSRSLSSSGLPLVRGGLVAFPSLLEPIVTAPFWLLGSVETGFRASMVLNSIAMSLAAVPVYWLGRRLGLSGWLALGPSALALATPSMLYSSWMMGEALAYPLFLTGFSMGVLALSGERRWTVPALVFFALASLARIQLLVLPLAFALAAVLMAARERRFRQFLGERRYLVGAGVVLAVVVLVVPSGALGFYSSVRHIDLAVGPFARHLGVQAIGLLFACAWIVLPGALIGLGLGLFRPRSRIELGFVCGALVVTLGLLPAGFALRRRLDPTGALPLLLCSAPCYLPRFAREPWLADATAARSSRPAHPRRRRADTDFDLGVRRAAKPIELPVRELPARGGIRSSRRLASDSGCDLRPRLGRAGATSLEAPRRARYLRAGDRIRSDGARTLHQSRHPQRRRTASLASSRQGVGRQVDRC